MAYAHTTYLPMPACLHALPPPTRWLLSLTTSTCLPMPMPMPLACHVMLVAFEFNKTIEHVWCAIY